MSRTNQWATLAGRYQDAFAKSETPDLSEVITQAKPITTLVPDQPGPFRNFMQAGEQDLARGNINQAERNFQLASQLVLRSPETTLHLMHTHLRSGAGRYRLAQQSLVDTLILLPELPLLNIHPRSFYGNPGDYTRALNELENILNEAGDQPGPYLLLAYLKWRDEDIPAAQAALEQAQRHARGETLIEAVDILRDGMAASGKLPESPATDANESNQTDKQ